ncbi:MAG TPA: hypothetical protein VMV10_14810 [Pirellulales bacterium]|nr:hypothetical protein [Pirellulales bacterium]
MSARVSPRTVRSRRRSSPDARRGVLLLIVLALLALLTLLGLTLVVATSQGRMSAVAAARANAEAVRDDSAVDEVLNQVVRGTNDSDSPLQGHSLLEDLYGPPQLYGRVLPTNAAAPAVVQVAGGQLLDMNVAASTGYGLAPYNGAYCGQVITMIDGPAQGYSSRIVGYLYNGGTPPTATIQVLSFNGLVPNPAMGTYLGDQFLVNGRPFSGTGFGFDLTKAGLGDMTGAPHLNTTWNPPTTLAAPYSLNIIMGNDVTGPMLTAQESTVTPDVPMPNKPGATGMPYAYLPNHAQIQLTQPLATAPKYAVPPYYFDVAGPGGANESYDAVDFQNMLLAMHVNYGSGNAITPIPSLHRPELIAWYAQQNYLLTSKSAVPLAIRRKAVLRPEPMDQVFLPSQDLNGNGVWDFREPFFDMDLSGTYTTGDYFLDLNGDALWTAGDLDYSGNQFNPITGCWYLQSSDTPPVWPPVKPPLWRKDNSAIGGLDVDNDNDGLPDSIWVDVGLPVQTLADGTQYKSLAAILCVDMDGKINLNAHGTIAQLDPNRYLNAEVGPTGSVAAPIVGSSYVDAKDGKTYYPSSGGLLYPMYSQSGIVQRIAPIGQGYGTAEVNPAYMLSRAATGSLTGAITPAALNYYTYLMMGYAYYDYSTTPPTFRYSVDGKYGESARVYPNSTYWGLFPPSNDNSPYPIPAVLTPPNPGYTFSYYLLGGPRPGWSRWIDPWMTNLTSSNSVLDPSLTGWDWVNDPMTLARFSDYRPYLLTPFNQLEGMNSQQGVFFDFIGAGLLPTAGSAAALPTAGSAAAPPWYSAISAQANPGVHLPTAHGSPYDLLARGVVATDLRGVPYYAGTTALPWMAGSAALGATDPSLPTAVTVPPVPPTGILYDASIDALNDAVDSPYELDLSPNAQHAGRITGNLGGKGDAPSDAPITPSELEGVLRVNDPDAADFRKRLDQLETVYVKDAAPTNPLVPPGTQPYPSSLRHARLSLTSESWDLPVPSVALTPQQMQDVAYFNNLFSVSNFPQLNLNGLSVTDLARARILSENVGNAAYTVPNAADLSLFGNINSNQAAAVSYSGVWPLLAPEVIMGLRLDINRLLGNGQDDNGNGVVDEPTEAVQVSGTVVMTEVMTYPWSPNKSLPDPSGAKNLSTLMNNTKQWLDLNNDGLLPMVGGVTPLITDPQYPGAAALGDPSLADTRARQLLARHLYVTMMLLLDDRSNNLNYLTEQKLMSNQYIAGAAQLPWSGLGANSRVQAAYLIAQWSINAVDFRDRDSIMTPFEFDIFPFRDDDANVLNGTWDVDDIIDPTGGVVLPGSKLDDSNPFYNNPAVPIRGIVWGCERPELLITETIATHDRGTDDTNKAEPPSTGNPDTYTNDPGSLDLDYDQVRRPRGSLILELYNATNIADAPQRDLQFDPQLPLQTPPLPQPWVGTDLNGNLGYGVNLSQVAVGTPLGGGPSASPVWRIAITYSLNFDESGFYTKSPYAAVVSPATPAALDPRAPILPPTYIHRAAYFAPYQPAFLNSSGLNMNEVPSAQSFFLDPGVFATGKGALMLPPDYYAVVGPAAPNTSGVNAIYLGENKKDIYPNSNSLVLQLGNQTAHNTTFASYNDSSGTLTPNSAYSAGNMKPIIGVPIQTTWLTTTPMGSTYPYTYLAHGAGIPSGTLRMSVSEPEYGYPLWPLTGGGSTWDDATYYSTTPPATPATPTITNFPTHPFDGGLSTYLPGTSTKPNSYVSPDGTDNMPQMTPFYTAVYLQRLADPLSPWNLTSNPYITVDSMPVDLTAYTGENQPTSSGTASAFEPSYAAANLPGSLTRIEAFTTRRRGYNPFNPSQALLTAEGAANCWTPLPVWQTSVTSGQFGISTGNGSLTTPLPNTGATYNATLGYLNSEYGTGYAAGAPPVGASGVTAASYLGDPPTPFPWITWNNRPYVSQYELMLVPASSPSSLCYDFDMIGWQGNLNAMPTPLTRYGGFAANEYFPVATTPIPPPAANPPALTSGQLPVAQFHHLLNYYDSEQPTTGASGNYMPNMFRIFEHVHVPSRFAGTQTMLTPYPFEPLPTAVAHSFHPPFNWASNYREPGKINLNTVFDPLTFEGLMDAYPGWATLWLDVLNSRQGFGAVNPVAPAPNWPTLWNPSASGYAQNGVLPTFFANPFRPDGAGALVPQASMTLSSLPLPPTSPLNLMHAWNYPGGTTNIYNGVNATMLRASNTSGTNWAPGATAAVSSTVSLFDDTNFDPNNTSAANFNLTSSTTQYRHAARNSYFQYQALQRLGNLATNRSNVYAVWITLGKFEVVRVPISPTNPDGYALFQEVGSSTGETERKRAFYLIDRSIPVGFARGDNLNVERTVLVERILDD